MVVFPNAKINLGLYITDRRADGYHNIESVLYPIPLCDVLEFIAAKNQKNRGATACHYYGHPLENPETDLCLRAWENLSRTFMLPALDLHLYKRIPVGTGLGGGSADGSFMLRALNRYFSLGISEGTLEEQALALGSDCPFFIRNRPALVRGRGEVIEPLSLELGGYYLVVLFTGESINTARAYRWLSGRSTGPAGHQSLRRIIEGGPASWRGRLKNQFEAHAFEVLPRLRGIKELLYRKGAVYASMTGSGSAIYGLFGKEVPDMGPLRDHILWQGYL